jgi:hypothetical protein
MQEAEAGGWRMEVEGRRRKQIRRKDAGGRSRRLEDGGRRQKKEAD